MTNPNQDVQAILREIVNDLRRTSAGLSYISTELHKRIQTSMADQVTGLEAAFQANQESYNKLLAKIDALEISPQSKRKRLLR
jgi:transposase